MIEIITGAARSADAARTGNAPLTCQAGKGGNAVASVSVGVGAGRIDLRQQ